MPLSEWPEHFRDDDYGDDDRNETVSLIFDPEEMFVRVSKPKSIGLADDEFSGVSIWIAKSQIKGDIPNRGDWITTLEVPKWLADEKELDYEW